MAISQMQELSLLLPKDLLDDVLSYLQNLQSVEIQNLQTKETWQGAFEQELVWNPDKSFGTSSNFDSAAGKTCKYD